MEGEGTFIVRRDKRRGNPSPAVYLEMTDLDTVERVRDIVEVGSKAIGIRHRGPTRKPIYFWNVQKGREAVALMYAIYPWMGRRRQEKIRECVSALVPDSARKPGRKT